MRTFVADNPDEVRKFARLAGAGGAAAARLVPLTPARCVDLSRKFGCDPEDVLPLARMAADLGVEVRGLSFHVGSQAADSTKHVEALQACAQLMAAARRERLGAFDTLDIGGGFPIDYAQPVQDISRFCAPLRAALAKLPRRVRVIAEPGRYIVGPCAIGVASVMGRARREGHWWYYLDDGLYGSYSGQLFDHARYPVEPLRDGAERLPSVLAGPTCDSIDVIAENLMLPQLQAGDLVVGRAMGAYTWASASEFNFFPKATVVAVNRAPGEAARSRQRCRSGHDVPGADPQRRVRHRLGAGAAQLPPLLGFLAAHGAPVHDREAVMARIPLAEHESGRLAGQRAARAAGGARARAGVARGDAGEVAGHVRAGAPRWSSSRMR